MLLGRVYAMSAEVAIVASTGGALGHATAAGRNEHVLCDLPGNVRAEAVATTRLRQRS